ncbi:MAG TPA: hypothetical protein VJC37_07030 [Planctomycetota bacterium]|nr:hypothetical protein [Planctomycetota bacterium]
MKSYLALFLLMLLVGCDTSVKQIESFKTDKNPGKYIEIQLAVEPSDSTKSNTPEDTKKAFEIIKARFYACKIYDAHVSLYTNNQISIKLPPVMDINQLERIKKIALATGKLEFKLEANQQIVRDYTEKFPKAPPGYVWYETEDTKNSSERGTRVLVHEKAELTGESLVSAGTRLVQMEGIVIEFKLNPYGTKIFADVTNKYARSVVGYEEIRRLAIIFDNKLIMAPAINTPITGGEGIITGHFTEQEAKDIVVIMLNGQMSSPLKIISETIPK